MIVGFIEEMISVLTLGGELIISLNLFIVFTDAVWRMTRKRKISVTHKTIGGGSKRSYLKSSGSQAYSKPDSTVPGQSTEPVGHVDEEASGCQNEETHYTKCSVRRLGVWNSLKPEMLRLSFESLAPASQFCSICKEHAEYRCLQCSTTAVFCETCIRATHRNSLHLPEKWNVSKKWKYLFLMFCFLNVNTNH